MTSTAITREWARALKQRVGSIPRSTVVVAVVSVVSDQVTKAWALSHLADGHVDHVVWTLQFNLSFNSGMAFGQAQGLGPFIAVLASVVIVAFVLSIKTSDGRLSAMAVGSIVGGAMGNLIDRLFRDEAWLRGRVVDFIDFQWFPIFNVADMCINVGGVLLVLGYFRASRRVA